MRVLTIALNAAWRALVIPGFAMMLCTLILSGALWICEGTVDNEELAFDDAFEALWCVFWIVTTLGYEGRFGTGGGIGQLIIAAAIICGLVLTTMPITFIGEAFASAWHRRELLLLEMRVQEELVRRGITVYEFKMLFDELDEDGRSASSCPTLPPTVPFLLTCPPSPSLLPSAAASSTGMSTRRRSSVSTSVCPSIRCEKSLRA